jgi:hypothetical protein
VAALSGSGPADPVRHERTFSIRGVSRGDAAPYFWLDGKPAYAREYRRYRMISLGPSYGF